ncbi:UDP-glucose 4-epimerase family protein [Polycyclovorans algicola]|uniref:UDP-glucose 4-epimerase family protein n=1 Tax=Polycyclovorans algicola TaxID=616992 RepID=UPI0004A6EE3F|nr:SDR family oxidoreductase [Polycyclovorans algicola]
MILVTGATGLVGAALVRRLCIDGVSQVVAAVRNAASGLPSQVHLVGGLELTGQTDWTPALQNVEAVVHCAARAHVMKDHEADPLDVYRRVNVEGTLNLARQAAAAGARRFLFVSSVKVNGEGTGPGCLFKVGDIPAPLDPYGQSKFEAEQGLREVATETGMEIVIIRPPVVYGPGVKANFATMMRWVARGAPLPLGAVRSNRRSLVALDNLVDLMVTCLDHPAAANQTFLVSDDEDLSTADLLERLGQAMGRPAKLIPVPMGVLMAGAAMLGKRSVAQRLLGSLQVDISKTRELLGWQPPIGVDEGFRRAVGR